MRKGTAFLALAAAAVGLLLIMERWLAGVADRVRPESSPTEAVSPRAPEQSPLAARLHQSGISPETDVQLVRRLVQDAMAIGSVTRTGAVTNAVALLCAPLPGAGPLMSPRHAAIVDGELVDRWGKPYMIMAGPDRDITVRSAGRDGEMGTADDAVSPDVVVESE